MIAGLMDESSADRKTSLLKAPGTTKQAKLEREREIWKKEIVFSKEPVEQVDVKTAALNDPSPFLDSKVLQRMIEASQEKLKDSNSR